MLPRDPAPFLHLCPHIVPEADVRKLALERQEAYVWSRIDGATTLQQLADLLGMTPSAVFTVLVYLEDAKAITWPDDAPLRPVADVPSTPRVTIEADLTNHPALKEPGDLDQEARLRILAMEQKVQRAAPWEILEIDPETPPPGIKKAYFQASKAFHPDRFFGKNIGTFAQRLQRIFEHIKGAQDWMLDEAMRRATLPPQPHPAAPAVAAAPQPAATASRATSEELQQHRQAITEQRQKSAQVDQAERASRRAAKLGDLTQARIWAERAVVLAPERVALRLLAAYVCEAARDFAAARRHLEVAASLDKNDNDVKNFLARLPHGQSNRH